MFHKQGSNKRVFGNTNSSKTNTRNQTFASTNFNDYLSGNIPNGD